MKCKLDQYSVQKEKREEPSKIGALCRIRRQPEGIDASRCSKADGTNSNLVDPASSHTLVSKIKPCMCKYKQFYTVKLRTAHYISYSLFDNTLLLG